MIAIPTQPRPNPNAFDFFVRAAKLSYEPDPKTDAARAAMVESNQPSLSLVREGFAYPYQMYTDSTLTQSFAYFAKFRSLARILAAEQQVKLSRHDFGGAMKSGLDGLQFAVQFQHGGSTVDRLVGDGCEAIARRHMWAEVDHLSAGEAATAARRLEAIDAGREPFANCLQQEEWHGESDLLAMLRGYSVGQMATELRMANDGLTVTGAQGSTAETDRDNRALFMLTKRQVMADYIARKDAERAAAMLPYNAPAQKRSDVGSDPINRLLVFQVPRSLYFNYTANAMNDRLLTVALALRAYHVRNTGYPASLNDLVTAGILAHVPEDPFTPTSGMSFGYRKLAGDTYLLYSVGPDGIDNDGAPIQVKDARSDREQISQATDKGDWVVGANTPSASNDLSITGFQRR